MGIPVKLQVFEGPLDLLLHLIDKNKIDIYDIPIVEITNQYMDYIRAMEREDLNVMSEFLVMAATLLDIKCRMLLPKEVKEDGEEEDPRQELVEQLLEYKMYKYMSYELRDREAEGQRALYRAPDLPEEVKEYVEPIDMDALLGDLTLAKLNSIFQDVIRRQADKIDPVRSTVRQDREGDGDPVPADGGYPYLCQEEPQVQLPGAFDQPEVQDPDRGHISGGAADDEGRVYPHRAGAAL